MISTFRAHGCSRPERLRSAFKDGTTHIVMEPLEFMERLAALVPRPRLHLIRFHGGLRHRHRALPELRRQLEHSTFA
jgi:hypothetical protein